MEGLCLEGLTLKPLDPSCEILVRPDNIACLPCKRRLWKANVPKLDNVMDCIVHESCTHNELAGLVGRHLMELSTITPEGTGLLRQNRTALRWSLRGRAPLAKWTAEEVIACYDGAKKRTYSKAWEGLLRVPLSKRDARLSAFVKPEKRYIGKASAPRMIQYRGPRYNLELLRYIKPIEKMLYAIRHPLSGLKVFSKGMNNRAKAKAIVQKYERCGGHVISADFSAFDAHVGLSILEEHKFYESLFPGDKRLQKLLSWQVDNVGWTRGGVKYSMKGRRASGDANTAAGNCLLVLLMMYSLPYDYLIDGDNVLIFADSASAGAEVQQHVLQFGHELKVDMYQKLSEIEYCQSKVVYVAGVATMVRNPFKVLSTTFVSHKHYHEPRGGARYTATVAQALMVINRGVPIIQAFAETERKAVRLMPAALEWELKIVEEISKAWQKIEPEPVTMDTRLSFEEAYGLSPTEQVAIEEALTTSKLPFVPEYCPLMVSSAGGLFDLSDPAV